jgi:D-amino-acid dehydrogenase
MPHFVVIGAGITGVTTAYALLDKGYDVTVIDRHDAAAMETSFANGGQLSASNAEVWNSWSTIMKGLKWLGHADAPLLMNPAPSWNKYSWLAEFVANVPNYRRNTVATTRLAIAAREHLFAMAERENIDFDLETRGILHVYRDKGGFDHATKVNALLSEGGLDRRAVTPTEIRAIEPSLTETYYGGFFTPSDSTGDIHKFTRGLAAASARRGVRFHYDSNVTDLRATEGGVEIRWSNALDPAFDDGGRFDGVVVCAGVASRRFASMLGDRVNIYPVKGYSITVGLNSAADQQGGPWVSLLDDAAKIVTSRLGANRLRVAGTAEFNGENREIRPERVRPLIEWTQRMFPGVSVDDVTPWAGLRPMMPNMMPLVGPGRRPGVFYNTGHGHLGWTLSAATATLVADAVEQGSAGRSRRPAALPVRPKLAATAQG